MLSYLSMKKKVPHINIKVKRIHLAFGLVALGVFTLISLSVFAFFKHYSNKAYPGVKVVGIDVAGMDTAEIQETVSNKISPPETFRMVLREPGIEEDKEFDILTSSFTVLYDYESMANEAIGFGRSGKFTDDLVQIVRNLFKTSNIALIINYDRDLLYEHISVVSAQVENKPTEPSASTLIDEVIINEGENGYKVEVEKEINNVVSALRNGRNSVVIDPVYSSVLLSSAQKQAYMAKVESIVGKSITYELEDEHVQDIGESELIALIDPYTSEFDEDRVQKLIDKFRPLVEREPANPVFRYEDGKVVEFSPAKDGIGVNMDKAVEDTLLALSEIQSEDIDGSVLGISVTKTEPEINTGEVNDLGIKELIGVGTSEFRGSISSRVHNVVHAASNFNGVLIKPGETFSFNDTIGDISTYTGYKQAYVIRGNETVLGDGGGVCQVSTTFFRAALDAGLEIVERHPHSYRVGYYEQDSGPGIDATIYHPTVDIKIKNTTPGHILIQTFADPTNMTLRFEFYGTDDGRIAEVTKPVITESTPPPEDLYIDDPTKPAGEIEQVDYKAWGAKVYFDYKVTRNGETLYEKTYYSNYKPWQARFIRGTGPAI